MSEVDVAVRRAQMVLRRMKIQLTRQEWARDEAHRRQCQAGAKGCDDVAWHYQRALEEGRVLVDGKPAPRRRR